MSTDNTTSDQDGIFMTVRYCNLRNQDVLLEGKHSGCLTGNPDLTSGQPNKVLITVDGGLAVPVNAQDEVRIYRPSRQRILGGCWCGDGHAEHHQGKCIPFDTLYAAACLLWTDLKRD